MRERGKRTKDHLPVTSPPLKVRNSPPLEEESEEKPDDSSMALTPQIFVSLPRTASFSRAKSPEYQFRYQSAHPAGESACWLDHSSGAHNARDGEPSVKPDPADGAVSSSIRSARVGAAQAGDAGDP